jgi:hypothetical protein
MYDRHHPLPRGRTYTDLSKDGTHDRRTQRISMGYFERLPYLKRLLMTSTLAPDCRLLQEYKSMVEQKGLSTSNVEIGNPFRWSPGMVTRVER